MRETWKSEKSPKIYEYPKNTEHNSVKPSKTR